MGKGGYNGGSTVVGPGSGWFSFKSGASVGKGKPNEIVDARIAAALARQGAKIKKRKENLKKAKALKKELRSQNTVRQKTHVTADRKPEDATLQRPDKPTRRDRTSDRMANVTVERRRSVVK